MRIYPPFCVLSQVGPCRRHSCKINTVLGIKHHLRTFFCGNIESYVAIYHIDKVVAIYLGLNLSADESSNCENYGVVDMHPDGNAPYQDEPLAIVGQDYDFRFEEDRDGISPETLEARFMKICPVSQWCSCTFCSDELLVGALEYRCCHEVVCAIGKAVFDGSIERIKCITEHEDYNPMVN
ncbi:Hypothetical predicted protein [Paramuricea clavata]|uniref:Uncharacterized protein n=1 Tax=Paramuricea clavata TaxID=317549 RepID=A0A6S7HZA3_PARCT|nr:Hypothetical predicted protein [Paramuricea clavata]